MQVITKRPYTGKTTKVLSREVDGAMELAVSQFEALGALSELSDVALEKLVQQQFKDQAERGDLSQTAQALSERLARIAAALAARESKELLDSAQAQAQAFRSQMVQTKKLLPSGEFCKALGISRQALSRAVAANRIFCIEFGGENYYPSFFADPKLNRRQLESVSKEMGNLPGDVKWQFFTTPKLTLNAKTPLKALAANQLKAVKDAAKGFAEL